jgi:molecular chaperone Hsp33
MVDEPASAALPRPSDDIVLPFATIRSRVGGRVVRLGTAVDAILERHAYPEPVSVVLGEALALAALLGNMLKPGAKLILQTKTDGALHLLVADCHAPGRLRGYAGYDRKRIAALAARGAMTSRGLLGNGHLAITIDPGGDKPRYQGIVALSGHSLSEAALVYFRDSEQLPTFIRLAVARHYTPRSGAAGGWHWRAGGLMLQHTAEDGRPLPDESAREEDDLEREDDWRRVELLAATVEDHELLDPTLSSERLLYRLFNEEGVRTGGPTPIAEHCRCSRERVETLLGSFDRGQLAGMREPDGGVTVTCEFCNASYRFAAGEIGRQP